MTRKVLAKFDTFDKAKEKELELIIQGEFKAQELQVRRKKDGFEVVVRTS